MGNRIPFIQKHQTKINTVSSTEAEIVGAGDFLKDIIWARHFLQAQGFDMKKNGQASLGKRSRHVNVRYFFVKDRLEYQTTSRLNTVTQKK